jgi:hypothetical protein
MTTGKTVPPALGDKDIVYVPSSKTKSVLVNGAAIVGASLVRSSIVFLDAYARLFLRFCFF